MSTVNSFDKNAHFNELNSPLFTGSGVVTPTARKALARTALGIDGAITTLLSDGVADAQFTQQPRVVQPAATAVNTSATVTGANIIAGLFTSTSAAAVALTLPLATAMETAMDAAYGTLDVGDSIVFTVVNTGPNTVTVTTNTGWTLVGSMAVATATSGTFIVQRNSATTYTAIRT